MMEFFMEPSLQ